MEQEYKKKIEEPKFFDKKNKGSSETINYEINNLSNYYSHNNNIIGEVYNDNTILLKIHDKKIVLYYEDDNGNILSNTDKIAILD